MSSSRSPFLDVLPPELRIQIYTHLLVASTPLKGPLARAFHSETYDIHTSILRTNKQIYSEARHVFFGLNTFHITSAPSLSLDGEEEEASGAFEPPLQLKDVPLIRHLEIDLIYYPKRLRFAIPGDVKAWMPISPGADRYMTSLSFLLNGMRKTLLGLKLFADIRPYGITGQDEKIDEDDMFEVEKFLTGFYAADRNWRFRDTLTTMSMDAVDLRFEFAESWFDITMEREMWREKRLVVLAGQVLVARSEIRIRAATEVVEEEEEVVLESDKMKGLLDEIVVHWPLQKSEG